MTSNTTIEQTNQGWNVNVFYGSRAFVLGPYRWKWVAHFVAWLESDQH